MSIDHRPLSAAVLAGGQSRRMGQDKALLPLVEGGPPMLAIVLDRVRAIADDVMIVANDSPRYEPFGARIAPDEHVGVGALGGIHAALRHAEHQHCLVVACDMPFLHPGLLARMASEPRAYDVLAPLLPGESRQRTGGLVYQTLHAIYGKSCIGPIEEELAAGNRQVVGFFSSVRVRTLELSEVQRWDPALRSFFNANTPEALATARRLANELEHANS
jgi:molybdopterin-guanine dinucleotide biosynthesis protein A